MGRQCGSELGYDLLRLSTDVDGTGERLKGEPWRHGNAHSQISAKIGCDLRDGHAFIDQLTVPPGRDRGGALVPDDRVT